MKYLKAKHRLFITSTLKTITFKNIGIALGYCCSLERTQINSDIINTKLTIQANKINNKIKTRIYSFIVPINILNENIMISIYNKIENYNKILNEYGYSVDLKSEILWTQNNIKMINSDIITNI